MAPPLLGPVWSPDGTAALVGAIAGKGFPLRREKQATRIVVDDYGNAVMYQRRCSICVRWRPLDFDHFAARNDGKGLGMQARCIICQPDEQRVRRRKDVERDRERQRRRYAAMSPEQRRERERRNLAARRRRWEREPERQRALVRANNRRYHQAVMADPERHRRRRESQRIQHRLRRERAGVPLDNIRPFGEAFDSPQTTVPSRQLVAVIDAHLGRDSGDPDAGALIALLERIDVPERTFTAWRSGERPRVELRVAGRVLTGLDLLWWDVWNADTVRIPLIKVVTYSKPRTRRPRSGRGFTVRERGERHYGDGGPDRDALAEIERAWEGDREEAVA